MLGALDFFGQADAGHQIHAFAGKIEQAHAAGSGGHFGQHAGEEIFGGGSRRAGLVQIAGGLVERVELVVFLLEIAGLQRHLAFQIGVERFEVGAHAVETIIELGEFGGVAGGHLRAEFTAADGLHAAAQNIQRPDYPQIKQHHHHTGAHQHHHHQGRLKKAQPFGVARIHVFH